MPVSEAEAFGPTATAEKKKADETGFIESALAGVATGLINIPKGFVSLGAELFDLVGDTNTAASVEKFFDDINPFDDEAEARTVGRITQALAQIGIPAFQGAKIGMGLARKAIDARKVGGYADLNRFGKIINNVKNSQLASGIGGAAVGEAIVSDEDIGTLGDMLRGTSLEPFAITMMDTEEKEGRSEAYRKLTNRLKFGVDGSLFNLGIAGAGRGITALRRPSKLGLQRYAEGDLKQMYEKYVKFGFGKAGMLPEEIFEAKRLGLDTAEGAKFEAGQRVEKLFDAVKKVVPKIETSIFKNEEGVLKQIQDIMQSVPGKKSIGIKPENLSDLIEKKSGIVNTARKILKFEDTPEGFRKLISREGPDGLFKPDDYQITTGGKMDKFLKEIEESVGKQSNKAAGKETADEFKNIILEMRTGVDNMTGKILQRNLQGDMSKKLQSEIGNYLTADYRHFDQSIFPFFRTAAANVQKEKALTYFVDREIVTEAAKRKVKPETLKADVDFMNNTRKKGEDVIAKYLTAKNLDDIDAIRAGEPLEAAKAGDTQKKYVDKPKGFDSKKQAKLEEEVIKINPEILRSKKLTEFEELIYGRITDPKHTYLSSISKMASLNHTLEFMDDIGKMGSKKGPGQFIFGDGTGEQSAIRDLLELSVKKNAKGEVIDLTADELAKGRAILSDSKQFKLVEPTSKNKNLIGLNPLEGKYVRAPIYDDIFETTVQFLNTNKIGTIYKYGVLAPKAISQITKTILSPITHARNLISAGAFAAANGAIIPTGGDFNSLLPKSLGGGVFKTAGTGEGLLETAKRLSYGRVRGTLTKQDVDLYKRLLKAGVVQTQLQAGELKRLGLDFYKKAFSSPVETEAKAFRGLLEGFRKGKKAYSKIQDAYVAEDDFWKTITWGLERNRYSTIFENKGITDIKTLQDALQGKKGFEDITNFLQDGVKRNYDSATKTYKGTYEEFLDEFAGNLSRNLVPNYSYVGRTGQALRLSPFGNFIAFPLEILRTGSNIIEQGIKERASGIPELVKLGNKRLLSFGITVGGIPKVAQESFKAMHDVSNEEMEALRRVVPEWSKNSTLLPMGRDKNGYLKYVDFSYSNAYDTLMRPFNTVFNAISDGKNDEASLKESLGAGLQESTVELLRPFTDESIFTEALVDSTIRKGVGKDGRRVWSEADDPFMKIVKGIGHVSKSFEPGSYKQLTRIGNSLLGKTDPVYGREYDLFDELPGLAGFGIKQSDPERSLIYKTSDFSSSLKKSENLFTSPLLKGGRVDPNDIISKYQYSEQSRFQTLKKMAKDIEAMRQLGMPDYKIRKELEKRRGLSKSTVSDIMLGVYTPKKPSEFFKQRMSEINRDLNKKEGTSMQNPYIIALPTLNSIINKNRRIDLIDGNLSMSNLDVGSPTSPSIISKVFNNDGPVRSNVSSTVAQLGAPGTNTSLTQPLKVEDVFKTGIV